MRHKPYVMRNGKQNPCEIYTQGTENLQNTKPEQGTRADLLPCGKLYKLADLEGREHDDDDVEQEVCQSGPEDILRVAYHASGT